MCYLGRSETFHQVEGVVPLLIAIVGDVLVNHVGDIHIAPEARAPLPVKAFQEGRRSVACFDSFCRDLTRHLAGVDGETDALTNQRRTMASGVADEQQTIA